MEKFCRYIFFAFAITLSSQIFAQVPKNLRDPAPMQNLPKLDRVETGRPQKQNSNVAANQQNDIIKIKGPYLSEVEVVNRSQADGKISPEEKRLIDRARAMPQTE
jgi:hypothetical protein